MARALFQPSSRCNGFFFFEDLPPRDARNVSSANKPVSYLNSMRVAHRCPFLRGFPLKLKKWVIFLLQKFSPKIPTVFFFLSQKVDWSLCCECIEIFRNGNTKVSVTFFISFVLASLLLLCNHDIFRKPEKLHQPPILLWRKS